MSTADDRRLELFDRGDRPSCGANASMRTITTRPTRGAGEILEAEGADRVDAGEPGDVMASGVDSCWCRLTAADRRWSWCQVSRCWS